MKKGYPTFFSKIAEFLQKLNSNHFNNQHYKNIANITGIVIMEIR